MNQIINDIKIIKNFFLKDERGYNLKINHDNSFSPKDILITYNLERHTLRGFHYRKDFKEEKIITCIQGKIFDVIVDLRKKSNSYLSWNVNEISSKDNKSIYCPAGCAHAYLTLSKNTLVHYAINIEYDSNFDKGFIWNDSTINVKWPHFPKIISEKDLNLKKLKTLGF